MLNTLKRILRTPTPQEMLRKQLDDAERLRIEVIADREVCDATVSLLDGRIARIKAELKGGAA
jgi:hypothetical protein